METKFTKGEFPEKIYAVEYAGFISLQEEPNYNAHDLLSRDDSANARNFGIEVCDRYNNYKEMYQALTEAESAFRDAGYVIPANGIRELLKKIK